MSGPLNRLRKRIALAYLEDLRRYCQGRLDAGDLDFDDWIYKTRDAATELLTIHARLNPEPEERA